VKARGAVCFARRAWRGTGSTALLFCGNELADAAERHSMFGKTPMDWSQLDRAPGRAEQHYFLCAVRLGYDRSRRETRLPRPVHSVQNACFRALSTVHGLHRRDSDRLPAVRCHDDSVRHKYRYHD